MASKRAIRRKSCAHKQRYDTRHAASHTIRRLHATGVTAGMLVIYACQFCGGFHFGHPTSRMRRAIDGT